MIHLATGSDCLWRFDLAVAIMSDTAACTVPLLEVASQLWQHKHNNSDYDLHHTFHGSAIKWGSQCL